MSLVQLAAGNAVGVDVDRASAVYRSVLIPGEVVHAAFQFYRDVLLLTDRRYLEIDYQGVTGGKTQFLSIPWGRISAFAVETAGPVDLDSELKLWVFGMSPSTPAARKAGCTVFHRFGRGVDALGVERVLADHLCPVVGNGSPERPDPRS